MVDVARVHAENVTECARPVDLVDRRLPVGRGDVDLFGVGIDYLHAGHRGDHRSRRKDRCQNTGFLFHGITPFPLQEFGRDQKKRILPSSRFLLWNCTRMPRGLRTFVLCRQGFACIGKELYFLILAYMIFTQKSTCFSTLRRGRQFFQSKRSPFPKRKRGLLPPLRFSQTKMRRGSFLPRLILQKALGAPAGIRTQDLLIRSQTLYPAELRAHP